MIANILLMCTCLLLNVNNLYNDTSVTSLITNQHVLFSQVLFDTVVFGKQRVFFFFSWSNKKKEKNTNILSDGAFYVFCPFIKIKQ